MTDFGCQISPNYNKSKMNVISKMSTSSQAFSITFFLPKNLVFVFHVQSLSS